MRAAADTLTLAGASQRGWRAAATRAGAPILGLLVVVGLWQVAALVAANATLVPPPATVGRAWLALAGSELPGDIAASLVHLALGFGLGVATGLLLALLAARFAVLEALVDPLMEFLRPISAIAWIPIAILIFGVGEGVPVFLVFYAAVFPIFVSTLAGIRRVDETLVRAGSSLGASRRMVVTHIVLPAALPAVMDGARISLGVAWMAMVAGELVGGDAGLGWRILWYQEFFAMDRVMALILTIGVVGFAADGLLRLLQRRLLSWHVSSVEPLQ
jgi:ABC-type nitrate/sulfonate/bicarbonate transport system permease component